MGDSDEEEANEGGGGISQTLSLTSFLFGNIDAHGQLEGDVFDGECKRQLASLSRLGLGSLLRQVTDDGEDDEEEDEDEDEQGDDDEEVLEKSPSAVDYSDINEAVEEDALAQEEDDGEDYDLDDDDNGINKSDAELMPPPPPKISEAGTTSPSGDKRRLITPLAAMLPSKYQNVDVRELFPDFRMDAVLRFSRLFGPGKLSNLPKIWKTVRRKKKRRQHSLDDRSMLSSDDGYPSEDSVISVADIPRGFELQFGTEPPPDSCFPDDAVRFSQTQEQDTTTSNQKNEGGKNGDRDPNRPHEADWRYGPAQLWYDMLDVPPAGGNFDYGFKLKLQEMKPPEKIEMKTEEPEIEQPLKMILRMNVYDADNEGEFPDDCFHMVTQYNWEEDIIWNGDDIKHKLNQKRKNMAAGWVPSSYNRTAQAFSQPSKVTTPFASAKAAKTKSQMPKGNLDDTWYSIFPVENEELVYGRWEDNIIWDPENMDNIPEPTVLTLDPNDENIILGIPEDVDPSTLAQGTDAPVKVKIPHPHVKKSKILLGKAGVITTIEEESPPPPPKSPDKDPFNISNDEYYQPKSSEQTIKMSMGGGLLQHSTPVVELQPPFIPTYMGEKKLRLFHRPPIKRYSHGPLSTLGPHAVHPLTKEIKKKAKQRENERLASGGGDVFFMRTPEDLTGKDGDVILLEYCEEYPPLLSQVGMATRIKNYYKRKAGNDKGPPEFRFGETAYAHTSPFLGAMHPGQSIQTIENNMYRAPMYEHKIPYTDFLVLRTRNGYSIREVDGLFTVGQECPLYETPGPNSKRANNFIRDFLQVFIYRLFWKSKDNPRRIKMDEIKRAFPAHSESSIRKRLKPCADFKRTGVDSNWWVIKPEFRLPTEEEIRAMVSPEQCCAFFSMCAAEQRLKDAGYGDKFLSALEDDNDDDTQKLDDEIKVAPWHTTRAYIQAVRGKCLLQLTGPADPTGCGEGFSYIRIPNKPTQNKEEQEQQPKRTVTGTDADLRRLSLNNAKNLLRQYGVPEEEIKKLTRWEVIDVVRTLSTEKAKAGEEGMNKFSRGNRFSIAEHQERYKEECQRIFDLQNRVLNSEEVLSTDEGSSEEEDNDSDMEEKGKYIENILANKKTSSQMTLEKEEQERKELQKMIMGEDDKDGDKKKSTKKEEDENSQFGFGTPGRLLRITRTFKTGDGKEYTRTEIVRKTAVIDTYVKIRTSKDESFIKSFAGQLDETQKEEMKRERRRLQEQLRRIKRNQERQQKGIVTPPKTKKPKLKPDLKLKCGACGQVGHMRTNKACPMYAGNTSNTQPISVAMTEEQEEEMEKVGIEESEELINVDGTKIKLSSKVIKHAEEIKRRSLVLKVPKDQVKNAKRRRAGTVVHCDYLKRKERSVNRRRIDPVITLSTIFEEMLNEMREMSDAQPFLFPVNIKQVPDYYDIVSHPMDLSTIRDNLRQKKYQSREEFLSDISQIVENSKLYNGVKSTLTVTAQKMLELCIDRFAEKEDKLMRLEKAINPLLDDDDQVAFDYILDNIVNQKLFSMQESWPFMKPVNKKNVKDYYEIIQNPMDLSTIAKKVKNHKYHSRAEFMADMELILTNSVRYNGQDSSFTQKAETLLQVCKESLAEYETHLDSLEKKISLAQERALEQAETDSLGTSLGPDDDTNYTYAEPEQDHPDQQLGSPSDNMMGYSGLYGDEDDEHVNVVDGDEEDMMPSAKRRRVQESQRNVLEEDLEFSDDEEDFGGRRQVEMEGDLAAGMVLEEGQYINPQGPDETQGAAEAMVQLAAQYSYYQGEGSGDEHQDGLVGDNSMVVDASYDPSVEFLGGMMPSQPHDDATINNDLEVSDSDDEAGHQAQQQVQEPPPDEEDALWF
ncbi:transcription initiation factor TFIID subunit 1-like isoform X2 [Penaeus chinensis]|uniref:transcription initiation factor TFIID subunit 1-like isoform X2 n=1 Tax=Penaeus chinensis TaxID=139456 RepID=UPI001FB5912F|nr:transcription initiation factor TFIID subunit 1-like isoform X2 [Penaeus chinensis]